MRKLVFIILCLTFLSEAYLSLASLPVAVKITGCVEKGAFISEEIDFGTHKVKMTENKTFSKIKPVDNSLKPINLSSYEGKKIKASGHLLPGDSFIVSQKNIKVIGECINKKENPQNRKLSLKEQSEDRAQEIIWSLPEVKKHSERIKSMGKRPFTRIESRLEGESGDKAFYIVYFGEDHGTHVVNIMTFYVNAYTERIYVYDPILDMQYPLEQWRMMQ